MKIMLINAILFVKDYWKYLQNIIKFFQKTIQFSWLTNLTVKRSQAQRWHLITCFPESTFYLNFTDSHCSNQYEIESSSDESKIWLVERHRLHISNDSWSNKWMLGTL